MTMSSKSKVFMTFTVILLLFFNLNFSGCLGEDQEEIVGIPEGATPDGTIYDDHVNASVPIMNSYDEPKQIVMEYEIGTEEGGRYSESKFITLPKGSQDIYYQIVSFPENETPDYVDTEIIVGADEIKVIEVSGEGSEGYALVNATIANTKFESERSRFDFKVFTDEDVHEEQKIIDVSESSIETYTRELDIPPDENPVDFEVQKF